MDPESRVILARVHDRRGARGRHDIDAGVNGDVLFVSAAADEDGIARGRGIDRRLYGLVGPAGPYGQRFRLNGLRGRNRDGDGDRRHDSQSYHSGHYSTFYNYTTFVFLNASISVAEQAIARPTGEINSSATHSVLGWLARNRIYTFYYEK